MQMHNIVRKIFILVIICVPLISMERPEIADELNFITKEGRAIRCSLLRAMTDAITGVDSEQSALTEDGIDEELLTASPELFVQLARKRFEEYVKQIYEKKGITSEMIDAQMDWAKEHLNHVIKKTAYEKPTAVLKREIEDVAQEMGVAKPVLKKLRDGNAMGACVNDVVYDPVASKKAMPSPRRRKAGWAHELFHNHHGDTIRMVAARRAFKVAKKEDACTPNSKKAILRVFEVFADAAPQARSREYALHFERLWKRQMNLNNNPVASAHPADRHRHAQANLMTQFHDEFAREQERNVKRKLLEEFDAITATEEIANKTDQ
jgi:hypothetical protein